MLVFFLIFPLTYAILAVVSEGLDRNAWRDIVHLLSGIQFSDVLR